MKKILLPVVALLSISLSTGTVFAATEYQVKTIKNISYLSEPVKDEYRTRMSVLDLYLPEGAKNFPTLVYFHGGGMTGGKRGGPVQLVKLGIAVAAVEYRLYPKCKHPEYIEDCAAATAWVFKNISKYGGNPDKVFIGGYSAGSYLAGMIAMDKKYLKAVGVDADKLAGVLMQSGHTITHFTVRKQLGYKVQQGVCDENSPMYHIRKTPFPILLQCGDNDYPSRQEENRLFESMMRRYAKQPERLIKYREYPGTHGTLGRNAGFKHDTAVFILKNSGMPHPDYSTPQNIPVMVCRTYDGNNYMEPANLNLGGDAVAVKFDGKSIPVSGSGVFKIKNSETPSGITLIRQLHIKKIAPVKEYHLKDGLQNTLQCPNGVKVWTENGNIVFSLNRKTNKIKSPLKGRYYTGDGIEIFVDRTPLRKLTRDNNRAFPKDLNIKQFLFSAKPDADGKSMQVLQLSSGGANITGKSKAAMMAKTTADGYSIRITIPLEEISALNPENVIGLNIQVNSFENGKGKHEALSASNAASHARRFHYPLFKLDASEKLQSVKK